MGDLKRCVKIVKGIVVSDKMQKTIVVKVDRRVKHPLYKKVMTRSTKLKAHDEEEISKEGDIVLLKEIPLKSKSKSWVLQEIVSKNG